MATKYFYYDYVDEAGWQKGGDTDPYMVFADLVNYGQSAFDEKGENIIFPDENDFEYDEDGELLTDDDGLPVLQNKSEVFLWNVLFNGKRPDLNEKFDTVLNKFIEWTETAKNGESVHFFGIEVTCESDEEMDEEAKIFFIDHYDAILGYIVHWVEDVSEISDEIVNEYEYVVRPNGEIRPLYESDFPNGYYRRNNQKRPPLADNTLVWLQDALEGAIPKFAELFQKKISELVDWGKTAETGDTFDFLGNEITCKTYGEIED